jgi:hypothetical protein
VSRNDRADLMTAIARALGYDGPPVQNTREFRRLCPAISAEYSSLQRAQLQAILTKLGAQPMTQRQAEIADRDRRIVERLLADDHPSLRKVGAEFDVSGQTIKNVADVAGLVAVRGCWGVRKLSRAAAPNPGVAAECSAGKGP